ncbi:ferredoxin, 2Fe-2S [Candidatus Kryptobacter tengchongensis]|nr:ferredoxin, 2Fe-2S [Candidatus Kryptobacter tengchongensis]CUU09004.1 ferredoxin, 2Fe-2S [Candidatus Kryptobacter tengchongensis]
MPVINFHGLGIKITCDFGETIFEVAMKNSIPLAESCGGEKICGHCRITVIHGIENLSEPEPDERKLMAEKRFSENERLACSTRIYGDVKITTSYW